jgi:choline dehydrogenase-like flavoprotein
MAAPAGDAVSRSAIVVGSGAGGSVAAWELRRAGYDVVIFEKGRNVLPGLGGPGPIGSLFGNDEVKPGRAFENQDEFLEPRTARTQKDARDGVERTFIGDVNDLPTVVGGGTVHWDAKTPRFWKQDFKGLSLYGPVPDANVADWPLAYDDIAPYYDEVEVRLGVQGDVDQIPASTLAQAPRDHQFPNPPNPPMYGGKLLRAGAERLGYTAYPFPMAVNSRPYDGRPRCNSCGFCSGFGCPINARGGAAVSFLHHALRDGAELRERCFVHRIDVSRDGRRALGVSYLDRHGRRRRERADVVILAASAIETARLMLLSATPAHPHGLGNRSGQLGRNLMFHFFTLGFGVFPEQVHAWIGPSTTFTIDDFVGPFFTPVARAAGLPYLKGGICETGGSFLLLDEAGIYTAFPDTWGKPLKELMRVGAIRDHISGMSMVGEDMPQLGNRVDLDPKIRDVYGFAVPRITRSPHKHELVASQFIGPKLQAICQAAPRALLSGFIPIGTIAAETGEDASQFAGPASTAHVMGTARMGEDPRRSVTGAYGQVHEIEGLHLADGSVFVSSGGFNPTVTIMALSLRMARHLAGH